MDTDQSVWKVFLSEQAENKNIAHVHMGEKIKMEPEFSGSDQIVPSTHYESTLFDFSRLILKGVQQWVQHF